MSKVLEEYQGTKKMGTTTASARRTAVNTPASRPTNVILTHLLKGNLLLCSYTCLIPESDIMSSVELLYTCELYILHIVVGVAFPAVLAVSFEKQDTSSFIHYVNLDFLAWRCYHI